MLLPPAPPDLESRTMERASGATTAMGGAGRATRELPPAETNTAAARANVQEPPAETEARAQGDLTAALREQPAPSPEIEQLCADIQDAIENRRPVDEASLRRTNPEEEAQEVGQALNDDISADSQRVAGDYATVNAPPAGTPTQVSEPLPDTPSTVSTPEVNAARATPPEVPSENVDLGPDLAASQSQVADAGMTTEPAQLITTGPVADARAGLGELEQAAAEAPGEVLRQQDEAIAASREAARGVEQRALAALEASRAGTVQDTFAGQLAMATSEEEQRALVAATAEGIFTTAQGAVNDLLDPMVSTAMEMWNTGKDRIATAFDRELQRAKEMVDERHEGVGGAIVSIWDDVTGLPAYITDIYTRAERTFGRDICALIREVSTYVNGIVIACEELIDNADRDIAALFDNLPAELQDWATQQREGFQNRLDGLRDNVHDAQQNFTDDLVSQAGDAVQEARERIDALREAAKGLLQKVADAVNAFLEDPVRAIINGLLTLVGIAPAAFWALLGRIEQVAADIADDPLNFANNLMAAVRLGFENFFGNFFNHLLTGFVNWLFSAMGTVGVQLPPDTSLKSIITFFLQIMGLTWPNIRQILVRHIGERNVALIEKAYELLTVLIEQGPGGIFEMIKDRLDPATMLQTIIEAAVSYLVERIVAVATVRILGLFNPAGAILQAIEAIYKVLKWIFENAARIFQLVETIVNGVADLIAGNIAGMAARTEQALAGMLVPVIDFIAGFLNLGDLPEKVAEVVGRFQQVVLAAVDRAIGFLVERARSLLASLGIGGGGGDADESDDEEVGKSISFSADGESHRTWIDDSGSVPSVMVASTTETLEQKVRRWNTEVDLPAHAENAPTIRQLLPEVNRLLGITVEEAIEAKVADLAEDQNSTIESQAEAKRQDDEVEAKQEEIVPLLRQLFELFGEELDLTIFERDLNLMAPLATSDAYMELEQQSDLYLQQESWSAVRALMVQSGSIATLHQLPLGSGSSRPFQSSNYENIFQASLTDVLAELGVTALELRIGPAAYTERRRQYIHGQAGPPDGEEGTSSERLALLSDLQRMLFQGNHSNQARQSAKDYFQSALATNQFVRLHATGLNSELKASVVDFSTDMLDDLIADLESKAELVTAFNGDSELLRGWEEARSTPLSESQRRDQKTLTFLTKLRDSIDLNLEEGLGGHSIERHGAQLSMHDMQQRVLGTHPSFPQSRSAMKFKSFGAHAGSVNFAYRHYRDEIKQMYLTGGVYKTWDSLTYSSDTGEGYTNTQTRSNPNAVAVTSDTVIIATRPDESRDDLFSLDSAYPGYPT